MADIFLSYASEDRERVRPLAEALEEQGYSVWWDKRISVGTSFDREIERELDACSCVVVVWSHQSVESDWVRNEAGEGFQRGILVPVQIDEARLPLEFRRVQTANLVDWSGDASASPLESLIASVQGLVDKPSSQVMPASKTQNADHRQRIAVLPFVNRSADSEYELLTEGMSEDIISGLTVFREISVVPSSTTSTFKAQSIDVVKFGKDVGAAYVLQGSVSVTSERVRVTVQLTSVQDRELVWSQSFDRVLDPGQIFELQDEIKENVSATIADSYGIIRTKELKQIRKTPPETMTAYQAVLLAQACIREGHPATLQKKALDALEEATKREPGYADGWAWLGAMRRDKPSLKHRAANLSLAEEAARQALELDSSNQEALIVLLHVHRYRSEMDAFKQIVDRAVALNPHSADLHTVIALSMAWAGLDDALSHATRAIDLHPDPLAIMFLAQFLHHYRKGDDDLAVDAAQRGLPRLAMSQQSLIAQMFLTGLVAAFGQLGRMDEAISYATKLRDDYNWDSQIARSILKWNNCCPELASRIEDGLRKAGIEFPPGS